MGLLFWYNGSIFAIYCTLVWENHSSKSPSHLPAQDPSPSETLSRRSRRHHNSDNIRKNNAHTGRCFNISPSLAQSHRPKVQYFFREKCFLLVLFCVCLCFQRASPYVLSPSAYQCVVQRAFSALLRKTPQSYGFFYTSKYIAPNFSISSAIWTIRL